MQFKLQNSISTLDLKGLKKQIKETGLNSSCGNNLYLTGGGSMLRGLDKRISQKTKLPVYVAEDPLRAVARGTGIALKNIEKFPFLIK